MARTLFLFETGPDSVTRGLLIQLLVITQQKIGT